MHAQHCFTFSHCSVADREFTFEFDAAIFDFARCQTRKRLSFFLNLHGSPVGNSARTNL